MAEYQTKPRQKLISFLRRNPDKSYTAEELIAALQAEYAEEAPGKSTVYRLIGKLIQENQLRRFEQDGSRCAYYQLNSCGSCDHLHLKCTGCGQLIHMQEGESKLLLSEILQKNGFTVDEHQTVLFGQCKKCQKFTKRSYST